jgi:hypothetical protein
MFYATADRDRIKLPRDPFKATVARVRSVGSRPAPSTGASILIGFHIDYELLDDGRFDTAYADPLACCVYQDYAAVEKLFAMAPPRAAATFESARLHPLSLLSQRGSSF